MKKKLLVIANFTKLPNENGNSRFTYIINLIDKEKYDVELITSSFSHGEKKQRGEIKIEGLDYKITLIKEPGYKKNVSLKRFYSHYIFAKNVKKYLEKSKNNPDIIYCAVPSLDVAKVVSNFAKKNNVRFIIDIQDLWPEAFKMVFNVPVISNIIFAPMERLANKIYSKADDIVAVSDTYVKRAIKVNQKCDKKLTVFLGTDLDYFDKCKNKDKLEKDKKNLEIAYIGTLGHSYNIKNIIDAIAILNQKEIENIKFVIMGNGPLEQEFKNYAIEKNVTCEFTGRLDYEKMIPRLCEADIAVNPIKKGAAQSIINKVGDYAAAGLPVISTQECTEYKKIVEDYKIGYNVQNDSPEEIAEKILELYNNEELRKEYGKNNRYLAEEKFNRKTNYLKIKELIEKGQ